MALILLRMCKGLCELYLSIFIILQIKTEKFKQKFNNFKITINLLHYYKYVYNNSFIFQKQNIYKADTVLHFLQI